MTTYIFEIQNCIRIPVIAEDVTTAREDLIDNLSSFADDMIQDCVISDGEESVSRK